MDFLYRYGHLPFAVWVKILVIFKDVIIFSRIASVIVCSVLKADQQIRFLLVTAL